MNGTRFAAVAAMSWAALILASGCGREMTAPDTDGLGSLSLLVVSGNGQSGVVGTELPQPLVVKVTNSKGVGLGGVTVNFRVVSGGGSMYAGTAVTDATNTTNKGNAADYWTLGTSTGQVQRVEVRAVTSTGQKQVYGVFSATAVAAAAAQIAVQAGDGQTANVSTNVPIAPAVLVRDQYGNPVPGLAVTFAVASGGGSVSGGNAATNASGIATVGSWTLGSNAGTNTLTATASGSGIAGNPVTFTAMARSPWVTRASMPTARIGIGVVTIDGIIYAVGGYNNQNGSTFTTVEAYDPGTETWTTKASMPTSRGLLGVAAINGILYAVGGFHCCINSGPVATVEAYDPATNTWTSKASMPTPRQYLGVAAVNGILYAVGGFNDTDVSTTVEAYDPSTDTWTTKAPMPTGRGYLGVAAIDGQIYAIGGYHTGALATVEAYDPGSDTWVAKASLPIARYALGASFLNGVLYAVGGEDHDVATAEFEAYDPSTNTWTVQPSMPTARDFLGVAAANGSLFAIGGTNAPFNNGGNLSTVEAFHP